MEKLYLSFLWHMHQPFYKNLFTGDYLLPWVLLHGTKDYFDMAYILKEFPGLKQNFNLVPSLLKQLIDYEDLQTKDVYLEIFRTAPKDLTESQKIYLLMNFFNANWDNMIKPFPRYYELLKKRGFYYPKEGIKEIKDYFTDEELRDIQIFFFLVWIDPIFFEKFDGLRYLKTKGKSFSEDDKKIIEEVQRSILKGIIPLYKELSSEGTIELSTSPYYHPIIPLLIDSNAAKEALPNVALPEKIFRQKGDASHQIKTAIDLFSQFFGYIPRGMWPPEGSVSNDAFALYAENGVEWLVTDEDILFRSLGVNNTRDGYGNLMGPDLLYRPYVWEREGRSLKVLYRDKQLSDLISFHYSRMGAKDAAEDCLRRLKEIRNSVKGRIKMPIVTIAMDGENAWENYTNDGWDFLRYLYDGILKEDSIVPTTIGEYLNIAEDSGRLSSTFAGSWIGHNFSIWIGQVEDNTGWNLLSQTRDFLQNEDPEMKNEKAWESIYIAEGSDWFWWYGDDHSSENDEIFDFLFRENLANAYRFSGKEPPETLAIPILLEDQEIRPTREPIDFIYPKIDGKVTTYFDWIGSGFIEGKGHGVAMHDTATLIKGCYYGFNDRSFFLRADIDRNFIENMGDVSFEITLIAQSPIKIIYRVKGAIKETSIPVSLAYSDVLEMECPLEGLGTKTGEKIGLWISLKVKDMLVDRLPKRGYISVKMPSESFEMEMWYV
ncbi:MAG: amylopullulanase [Deltaproteobacteria bacterium]|nr:amylopullulanase [Deltaproteobacteria bacterium]